VQVKILAKTFLI